MKDKNESRKKRILDKYHNMEEGDNPMEVLTICLPIMDLVYIEIILNKKQTRFGGRSDLVRCAVREYIDKQIDITKVMEETVESFLEENRIHLIGDA